MNPFTMLRTALFVLLIATIAAAADKTPPTYQKGTSTGYDTRLDTWGSSSNANHRRAKVYDLKGPDLIYKVDYCGSFQAGEFKAGQVVDYRVDGKRLYILHDGDKEYSCKIEGTSVVEGAKPDAPSAAAPPAKP